MELLNEIRLKILRIFPEVELPAIDRRTFLACYYFDEFYEPCERFVNDNGHGENEIYLAKLSRVKEHCHELANVMMTKTERDFPEPETKPRKSFTAVPLESEIENAQILIERVVKKINEMYALRNKVRALLSCPVDFHLTRRNIKQKSAVDTFYDAYRITVHEEAPENIRVLCEQIRALNNQIKVTPGGKDVLSLITITEGEAKINSQAFINPEFHEAIKALKV